jgi:hypothetical protein
LGYEAAEKSLVAWAKTQFSRSPQVFYIAKSDSQALSQLRKNSACVLYLLMLCLTPALPLLLLQISRLPPMDLICAPPHLLLLEPQHPCSFVFHQYLHVRQLPKHREETLLNFERPRGRKCQQMLSHATFHYGFNR